MTLEDGNKEATVGMSKAIYDKMKEVIEPDLEGLTEDNLNTMRKSWQEMAYAIATGVIDHVKANMEIFGVTTQGNVNTTVQGNTGPADPSGHLHVVKLSGVASNVTFTQNNDGTGRAR